jgi:hypothetical protein
MGSRLSSRPRLLRLAALAVISGQAEKILAPDRSTFAPAVLSFGLSSPARGWCVTRIASRACRRCRLAPRHFDRRTSSSAFAVKIRTFGSAWRAIGGLPSKGPFHSGCGRSLIAPLPALSRKNEMIRLQTRYDLDGEHMTEVGFDSVDAGEISSRCDRNCNAGCSGAPRSSDPVDVILR